MTLTINNRLLLRNLSAEDAPEVFRVIDNNRANLRKWLPWVDTTNSAAVVESVIGKWEKQRKEGSDFVCGIFLDGSYIGNIGLHNIDRDNKKAVIGYWLSQAFQGRGIMTQCVGMLVNYAFEALRLKEINIHCATDNKKSRAIPERLGFMESGILKDGERLYGIQHDLVIYTAKK